MGSGRNLQEGAQRCPLSLPLTPPTSDASLACAPQLFLIGFCVLIRPGSVVQLITGCVFSVVMLLFTSIAEPFQRHADDKFSLLCNFSLVMIFFFSLVLKMGLLSEEFEGLDLLSSEAQAMYTFDAAGVAVALIFTLLASVIVASVLAVYQLCQSTRAAVRAVAIEHEASIARGRLSHPPTTSWELRESNCFGIFLSHFKEEAGSDARYLNDLIKRTTGCAAYLDSNDLVDLRTLFNEGERTDPSHARSRQEHTEHTELPSACTQHTQHTCRPTRHLLLVW